MWGYFLALEKTDHELLIELSTKMDLLYTMFANHLEHHFAYNITLLGGFLSLSIAAAMYLWKTRRSQRTKTEPKVEGEQ